MPTLLGNDRPILFLGLADHIAQGAQPFPIGGLDIFQLSRHKLHIIYPATIGGCQWVFLVDAEFIQSKQAIGTTIKLVHRDGMEAASVSIDSLEHSDSPPQTEATSFAQGAASSQPLWTVLDGTPFVLLSVVIDGAINWPGHYVLKANICGAEQEVGAIEFHYRQTPSLTADQIKALEADIGAAKFIRMILGCKFCDSKSAFYTGLKRQPRLERDGVLWYAEAPDEFSCECGRTCMPLRYLRESMHGMLLKDFSLASSGLSFVRQYGHGQVKAVADKFKALIAAEDLEPPIQAFLELNPVLLTRFHPKRLFVKPNIVGRFQADFAILDSHNELWFIEIERPALPLFKKKEGHPTAGLMHAYNQVNDWLMQYQRYPGAIHAALKIGSQDVVGVRGAVIAGRSDAVTHEVLQRHYGARPYPNIEFLLLDDLASSLIAMSRKLA